MKREEKLLALADWATSNESPINWKATSGCVLYKVEDEATKTVSRIMIDDLVSIIRSKASDHLNLLLKPSEETALSRLLTDRIRQASEDRIIEEPDLIGDADSERYCLCRLPYSLRTESLKWFDPEPKEFGPFIEQVVDAFEERDNMWAMLRCWLGKMLLEGSNAPEVLIWFGKGGDGKTTFFQSLQAALNDSVANVISQRTLTDRWGAAQIIDRRLVVVEEADDSHKIWTPELKMLTGNDTVTVERKYKDPIQAKNRSMVAVVTNAEPSLDKSSRAQLRRLRLLISNPVEGRKTRTQEEIKAEFLEHARDFFGACVAAYLERGYVPANSEQVINDLSEDTLGPVSSFARANFVYEEGAFLSLNALRDIMTAKGAKHSLKNVKVAIGNLDERIDTNVKRRIDGKEYRGIAHVKYHHTGQWTDPVDNSRLPGVQSGTQAREERKRAMACLEMEQ